MTPLFSNLNDVEEDRDSERKQRSVYATPRDIAIIVLAIAGILTVLYYVFFIPSRNRANWVSSQDNIRSIREALYLYAADNSDGLPAVYLPQEVDREGRPITWANQLFGYTRTEAFKNRASRSEYDTLLTYNHPQRDWITVNLSYGMLAGADTRRTYELRDDVRLLAETIGGGLAGTLNPLPLGERDGFMVGYDNSNRFPNSETEFVTRLAFPVQGGSPQTIHQWGTLAIRADGRLSILESRSEIRVEKLGNLPTGSWVVN